MKIFLSAICVNFCKTTSYSDSDGNDDDNDDDYEPPANSVEELLFREFIVLKLGLSRSGFLKEPLQ